MTGKQPSAAITFSSHAINSLQNEMQKETLTVFLFITCISSERPKLRRGVQKIKS